MAPRRRTLVGAGLAAAGVAGGLVVRQALVGQRRELSPATDERDGLGPDLPPDTEVHRVATSDGASLRVLARGTGSPIVLVHGVTLSADVWYHQLRSLPAAGYRVVAIDLRGHGGSTIGVDGLGFDRLAADIDEVLDALEVSGAVLVGHSLGGMIALWALTRTETKGAAIRRSGPPRVRALGLVATSAGPVAGRGLPGIRILARSAAPVVAATARLGLLLPGPSLPDGVIGDSLARIPFGAGASAADVSRTRRFTARVPARVSVDLIAQIVRFDEEDSLARVRVPATVVVGTEDVMTPVGHAEKLAERIPDARLVVIEGCGHMVMLEAPDHLDRAITALAGRSAAPLREAAGPR